MTEKEFIKGLENIGISLTEKQLEQFKKYYELLIEWNKIMNLTGITKFEDVYLKHYYDSATLFKAIDLDNVKTLCDIGTGAGFPGVVIKILFPKIKITLVDSLNKRINFLKEVINQLELKEIEAIHSRVETYHKKNYYDVVTCRAMSHLRIISEYAIPLVKEGAYFIPLKANINTEIIESETTLKKLNSKIEKIIEFELPIENSKRTILKIKKIKHNDKFPRKYNEIINNHL